MGPQVQYIDRVVDVPVERQRHVPMIQTVQKFVDVPQIQYVERVVDVPVQREVQVPVIMKVKKPIIVPIIETLEKIVDVPVVKQVEIPQVITVDRMVEVPSVQTVERIEEVPVMNTLEGMTTNVSIPSVQRQIAETSIEEVVEIGETLPGFTLEPIVVGFQGASEPVQPTVQVVETVEGTVPPTQFIQPVTETVVQPAEVP